MSFAVRQAKVAVPIGATVQMKLGVVAKAGGMAYLHGAAKPMVRRGASA